MKWSNQTECVREIQDPLNPSILLLQHFGKYIKHFWRAM